MGYPPIAYMGVTPPRGDSMRQPFLHKIVGGESKPLLIPVQKPVSVRHDTVKELVFGDDDVLACERDDVIIIGDNDTPEMVGVIRNKYPLFKPAPFGFKCGQCRNCMKGNYGSGGIARIDLRYSKVGTMSEIGYCKVQRTIVHTGWGCAAHNLKIKRRREIVNAPTDYMADEPAMYHGRRQLHNLEICRMEKERAVAKAAFEFLDQTTSARSRKETRTSSSTFTFPTLKSLGY